MGTSCMQSMHYHWHWLFELSLLSAVLLADLAPPWGEIRVKHTWNTVPAKWESLGPPPVGTTFDLYIALKPQSEDALIDALYEVSDPKHHKYGEHLSKEQVAELVAPHSDTLEIVHSWLEHHGVPPYSISTSHGGGWLTITGVPVSQANELLGASYQLYRHAGTQKTEAILRTVGYALPEALHAHVQTVAPTTHFTPPRTPLQTPRKRSSKGAAVMVNATSGEPMRAKRNRDPSGVVTPSFLRWLYKTAAYKPKATDRNGMGTLGFLTDYPSKMDLILFLDEFRADASTATFTRQYVVGEPDTNHPGEMGSLSSQYISAIAYPTAYIFYITGSHLRWFFNTPASDDAYLQWFSYLLRQDYIPPTISISYANPEPMFPHEYAKAVCSLFAHLGLRGTSVLVASGNDGVGPGHCRDNSGNVRFIPMFPASCPWVTSVGGTMDYNPEVAAELSGGGFSRFFPRPDYQDGAVTRFLTILGSKYAGRYPSGGRGIPDIAAQAQRFAYFRDSILYETNGTGCSTSTVAGIITLLNDHSFYEGKTPLGFLNLWLYGLDPGSLNDIISGSNPGCGCEGFRAIPGWDPVTGLGTPDFPALQRVIDKIDDP